MKFVKTTAFSLVFLVSGLISNAQFKIPVTNNELRGNLSKVISEFGNQFSEIKGPVTNENPQTTEYSSTLKFEGAEDNVITEYKGIKSIYSWQATLLTTEDFEEANKKYKWLCNQLKVMTVTIDGHYSYSLDGKIDPAVESKAFSSSIFTLMPAASNLPRIRIEAGLQFQFPEWKVQLLVYEKERNDNERGPIKE
jgi:hypothetical protein